MILNCLKGFVIIIDLGNTGLMAQVNDSTNFRDFFDDWVHYYDNTGLDTVKGSGYKDLSRWGWYWNSLVGTHNGNNNSFFPETIA